MSTNLRLKKLEMGAQYDYQWYAEIVRHPSTTAG
jgi:hypothetical protein